MIFGLPIGFTAPWVLLALILLPVLWLILRAIPPAPIRRGFPGVVLLLGLRDEDTVTDRTPWWLLLLRMLALAAVIVGLAGPLLNPEESGDGDGPLLIVMDASWASAPDWEARRAMVEALLDEAARD
ncbi:BatA domain-containing protein, partial [Roseobacter sp.]|uniref:BatA domain-containing protein n=1 Tax=Roseobacter sp. TaxID=1907202 RepID=UPI003298826F